MLSIGAGGLDVAVVMGGHPFEIACPEVVEVHLEGELARPWVQAKDVILELLRRLSVRGGKGKVFEFTGPGVATLSVPERGTIANMIAELGATSALFPPDARTREWPRAQGGGGGMSARTTCASSRPRTAARTTSAWRSTSARSAPSPPARRARTTSSAS